MLGIGPAQQRLGADDRAVGDAHDRLVVELQRVVLQRAAQRAFRACAGAAGARPGPRRGTGTCCGRAPSTGTSRRPRASAALRDRRNRPGTPRCRSTTSRRCRAPRCLNGCAIASSSFCAMRPRICGSSKSSTITMNSSPPRRASRSVSRSASDERARHVLQQLVADPVAERVVDVLEAVEVDEQHADAAAAAPAPARSPASAARAAAAGSAGRSARRASPCTAAALPPGSASSRPARTTGSTRCCRPRRAAPSGTTRTRSSCRPCV